MTSWLSPSSFSASATEAAQAASGSVWSLRCCSWRSDSMQRGKRLKGQLE